MTLVPERLGNLREMELRKRNILKKAKRGRIERVKRRRETKKQIGRKR